MTGSDNRQCECGCAGKGPDGCNDNRLETVIASWKGRPGALIPILQEAQRLFGWLSGATLRRIAEALGEPYSKVHGVVTFYSFFSLVPRGKFLIRVCLGTACYVRGAEGVLTALKQRLGIDVGQTTGDAMFTLETGRCFGACGLAPVIMVNDDVHQQVDPAQVEKIIRLYRKKPAEGGKGCCQ
jgi:NADH:ubiquinone oxidoreductase subunit E